MIPLVRPGEPRDLAEVRAIQAASPTAAQWDAVDYLNYRFRVATWGSGVAGFLVARTLSAGECEILNLVVVPEFRRQGVARALLTDLIQEFGGDIYLEVRASNQQARNFYKSLGFEELTIRPEYYDAPPEAAIVMKFHSC